MSISYFSFSYTILPCILLMNLILFCWGSPLGGVHGSSTHLCQKNESLALLHFKQSFTIDVDLYPFSFKIESWKNGTDCCTWEGIKCDPNTHNVVVLNLSTSGIRGSIHSNSTLFLLRHLQTLILSQNDMSYSTISPKFGEFSSLKHLDLSYSYFSGRVPLELAQLSKLRSIDLSGNEYLEMPYFEIIISNLTKLRHVDFSFVNLNNSHVPQCLTNLSSLTFLGLVECQLRGQLPVNILSLPRLNFLDLSDNYVYSDVHLFHNRSTSLEYLDLSFVNFSSTLPPFLPGEQPRHLSILRLRNCNLHGNIPSWVWNVSDQIDLSSNYFTSRSSDFLCKITNLTLTQLDLQDNNFRGNISLYDDILSKLPNLEGLMLSNSGLSVTMTNGPSTNSPSTWANSLQALLLSNTSITGNLPSWIQHAWEDSMNALDLSYNSITGGLQEILPWNNLVIFDISDNMLQGPLPLPDIGVFEFSARSNKFTGPLDSVICQFTLLTLLDLSNNSLSGEFPHCLGNLSEDLAVLNLGSNNIQGTLPTSFSNCGSLEYLDLSNNMIQGLLPRSLSSCKHLEILNLKHNKLNDEFPYWLQNLPQLQILDLSSNNFHGPIRHSDTKRPFPRLQVIDLSNNNLSGKMPESYIKNFRAMMNTSNNLGGPEYMSTIGNRTFYSYSISLTFSGEDNTYTRIISTLTTIDLSNNAFEGDIPPSIGGLIGLHGLNLSHNRLQGHIPRQIGDLLQLNFLDLSNNKLSGGIPQELASLTYLGVFNVSENQLAGAIPHGNNFNTFQQGSYKGNIGLCGFPLLECGHRNDSYTSSSSSHNDERNDNDEGDNVSMLSEWEIVLMGCGCGTILGLVWGYYMMSTGKPFWLAKLAYTVELFIVQAFKKSFGKCARRSGRN